MKYFQPQKITEFYNTRVTWWQRQWRLSLYLSTIGGQWRRYTTRVGGPEPRWGSPQKLRKNRQRSFPYCC